MTGETVMVGLGIALDLNIGHLQGCGPCGSNETYQDRFAGHYCDNCGTQLDTEEYSEYFRGRYYLELHPRSSLRAKGIGGGVGIIDIDYPDEIKMVLSNHIKMDTVDVAIRLFQIGYSALVLETPSEIVDKEMRAFALEYEDALGNVSIKRGDKIGQLILKRHEGYLLPAQYTINAERIGGFGSTSS